MKLNWANYKFLNVDGYGRMGLGFVQSLIRAGHSTYPFMIDELDEPAWFNNARGLDFSHVTVQLMPPHHMRNIPGRNIGYTMHESLSLPKDWAQCVNNSCQYLLVPSLWLIDLFKEGGVTVPIEMVPGGINPDECPVLPQRHDRPYTFGCLADRGGRKGHQKVEVAFYKAFDFKNRDVALLLKCRPGSMDRMDWSYSPDPRYRVWRSDVTNMADVYAQLDAYICPAKCEGYGMSQREAAACGLPVVVQRFSGTADNCDEWAIPLENYKLVESDMPYCGGEWAEPDLDELVETMRYLYLHQDDAKAKALKSADWLRGHETYAHSADKLVKVLNKWLGGPIPVDEEPIGKVGDIHDRPFPIYKPLEYELSFVPTNGNGRKVTV